MSNLQTPKLKFLCDNRTIPVSEESHSPSAYIHTYIQVGVTIDNKLKFDKQMDNVTRMVSQQLAVPKHLRNIIPLEKRKNFNFINHLLPPF